MKKTFSGTILIILIIGMLPLVFEIQPQVNAQAVDILVDTEEGESRFRTYPSRITPYYWVHVHDHDAFYTRAYGGNFWYTLCGEEGHDDPLYYGEWEVALPQSGDYEVLVWIPDPDPFEYDGRLYTPTESAIYQIYYESGMTTITVNQQSRIGGWYSIGTFTFDTTASIILNDRTGEPYLSTMIALDAIKLVPSSANNPPYTPSNPSPSNHALDVSINADLSWSGGDPDAGDTLTYDAHFGVSTPPPLVSNDQTATTYDLGTLDYSTTYYWKIVATDIHGASTEGIIWHFTTQPSLPSIHDLAITDVTPSQTTIPIGVSATIYVTVENQGTTAETFDVTTYYDITIIDTITTSLNAGDEDVLSFTWDTTGVAIGVYTLNADATIVSGEEDTADNSFLDGEVNIVEAPPPATIFVDPTNIVDPTLTPSNYFTITINVSDALNLCCWQIELWFDPSIIECTAVYCPPGHVFDGHLIISLCDIDNIGGNIAIGSALWGLDSVDVDQGVLCALEFHILCIGNCALTLDEAHSYLLDYDSHDILRTLEDGFFDNRVEGEVHDIAVTDVVPSSTSVIVGDSVTVDITVWNQGTEVETFDVTTYRDGYVIHSTTGITLNACERDMLSFTWNTTGFAIGVYTFSVEATIVPGEVDVADNSFENVIVEVVEVPPPATIFLDPASIVDPLLTPCKNFTIFINVSDAIDLTCWQIELWFDPSIIECTAVYCPPGHVFDGHLIISLCDIDNIGGNVRIGSSLFGSDSVDVDQGVLCALEFHVVDTGSCDLTFNQHKSFLLDSYSCDILTILEDGFFSNFVTDFSISASPTLLTIPRDTAGTAEITITSINGFSQPVQLTVSGTPPGVLTTPIPNPVTPPPDGVDTSTLIVAVNTTASLGSYTLRVIGSNGTLTRSVEIIMEIIDSPPICSIELQKDGVEISEIDVWQFFDIYVGDSTDDTGIKQVLFSSDDVQDGYPTGEWTESYAWGVSSGDWYAATKIKRWAFDTPGYKEVWAEVKDETGQTAVGFANIFVPAPALPVLTSPLVITPIKDIYNLGDSLEARFTIKNIRDIPITLNVLTVGGRLNGFIPPEGAPDFTFQSVPLQPNESYQYQGSLTLTRRGNYNFFVAYHIENPTPDEKRLLDENNWNTCVELGEGLTHNDRVKNIIVLEEGTAPEQYEQLKSRIDAEKNYHLQYQYPPNLLDDTSFGNRLGNVWMSFRSFFSRTDLAEQYRQLYHAGKGYQQLAFKTLTNAEQSMGNYDLEDARYFLNQAYRYDMMSAKSFAAAAELVDRNLELLETLVGYVAKGCELFVRYSIKICYPAAAPLADAFYVGINFGITTMLEGVDPAVKDALIDVVLKLIFFDRNFVSLQDNTILEYVNRVAEFVPLDTLLADEYFMQEFGTYLYVALENRIDNLILEETVSLITHWLVSLAESVFANRKSPVDIRVFDSKGRITGLINGVVKHEIPMSLYYNGTVTIFFPSDIYRFELVGTDQGTYGLEISSVEAWNVTTFNATNIPTLTNTTHQYTINWTALSQGEDAVTVQMDYDGDGIFEYYITVGSEFTVIFGDINFDGEVDMQDIGTAARAFGSYMGHPRWNPLVDINQDDQVDMRDIALIARNFGKTYP